MRVQVQKGFLATMFQVEKSHVPVSGDPPIVYPPAEVWKELTARRKEKYSASELSHHGPAEKKIDEALKSPTTIEFVETPLQDVVDYLKDLHKIEIQLDKKELESMSIGSDTLVTKNLKGISLRSALKLMLDELQSEVRGTQRGAVDHLPDPAESEEFLTTKVYPVADLVLPIQTPTMAGGMGGLGGMMGGMGGTMGGGMGWAAWVVAWAAGWAVAWVAWAEAWVAWAAEWVAAWDGRHVQCPDPPSSKPPQAAAVARWTGRLLLPLVRVESDPRG